MLGSSTTNKFPAQVSRNYRAQSTAQWNSIPSYAGNATNRLRTHKSFCGTSNFAWPASKNPQKWAGSTWTTKLRTIALQTLFLKQSKRAILCVILLPLILYINFKTLNFGPQISSFGLKSQLLASNFNFWPPNFAISLSEFDTAEMCSFVLWKRYCRLHSNVAETWSSWPNLKSVPKLKVGPQT